MEGIGVKIIEFMVGLRRGRRGIPQHRCVISHRHRGCSCVPPVQICCLDFYLIFVVSREIKPRNVYDFPRDEDDSEPYQLNEFNNNNIYMAPLETSLLDQREVLNRNDIGGTSFEHTIIEEEELKVSNDASDYVTDDYEYESLINEDEDSNSE
ncbi:unnamed protein product [Vicia faba]|uniref:Uncharacterized protein n=1 Tax=Vicia faba TaxID=3906 RepID=A0AAV0Z5J1_VICFA|nr:unnamed protein product [Vicia faba]